MTVKSGAVDSIGMAHGLGLVDFAMLLGVPPDQIPVECRKILNERDFRYTELNGAARDNIILEIIRTLDRDDMPVAGPGRLEHWEDGWSENLRLFVSNNYDAWQLTPGYYRRGRQAMRLFGKYVLPASPDFETDVLAFLRTWIGKTFLRDVDHVYEFGCGPAHNLVALSEIFPQKQYWGLDWAAASQEIISAIRRSRDINIAGIRFDMFAPDGGVKIETNSAVITMGTMEQLGEGFESFLKYLLQESPEICIQVEPIYELYDQCVLFDYLAAKYSEKRGYLRGYLTRLEELERKGLLEILHVKKYMGNLYHDGWTTLVWKPTQEHSGKAN